MGQSLFIYESSFATVVLDSVTQLLEYRYQLKMERELVDGRLDLFLVWSESVHLHSVRLIWQLSRLFCISPCLTVDLLYTKVSFLSFFKKKKKIIFFRFLHSKNTILNTTTHKRGLVKCTTKSET